MKRVFLFIATLPIWLMRIIFIAVLLFFLSGIPVFFLNRGAEPSVDKAPWAVQTYSYVNGEALPLRLYYGEEYSVMDGEPALAGYWSYDGKRYTYHKQVKLFPKSEWGAVSVIRRQG